MTDTARTIAAAGRLYSEARRAAAVRARPRLRLPNAYALATAIHAEKRGHGDVRLESFDEQVVKAYATLHPLPPELRRRALPRSPPRRIPIGGAARARGLRTSGPARDGNGLHRVGRSALDREEDLGHDSRSLRYLERSGCDRRAGYPLEPTVRSREAGRSSSSRSSGSRSTSASPTRPRPAWA